MTLRVGLGVAIECKENQVINDGDPHRRVGKTNYMAPEIFEMKDYNPQMADVW